MIAFDPRKFVLSFNGVPISGFGAGTFFKATRRKPFAALEELGADGEGAFVLSGDHSYDVELTLKRASPSNTLLSQFANATRMGAPVVGSMSAKDMSTGGTFDSEEVIQTDMPPFEREGGGKLGENVWKFSAKKGVENQPGAST